MFYIKIFIYQLFILFIVGGCDGLKKHSTLVELTRREYKENQDVVSFDYLKKYFVNFSNYTDKVKISDSNIVASSEIIQDRIYILDVRGGVYCFDIKQKKRIWKSSVVDVRNKQRVTIGDGSIVYNNSKLYISYGDRFLVTLNAENGFELLRKKFKGAITLPVLFLDEDKLIIQTDDDRVMLYDEESHKIEWFYDDNSELISIKNRESGFVFNDMIINYYKSGRIIALGKDGSKKWTSSVISNSHDQIKIPQINTSLVIKNPIVIGDYAYFITTNNKILKIDLYNGVLLWEKYIENIQDFVNYGDMIFVVNNARQVVALEIDKGNILWVGELRDQKEREIEKLDVVNFFKPFITKYSKTKDQLNLLNHSYKINKSLYNHFTEKFSGKLSGKSTSRLEDKTAEISSQEDQEIVKKLLEEDKLMRKQLAVNSQNNQNSEAEKEDVIFLSVISDHGKIYQFPLLFDQDLSQYQLDYLPYVKEIDKNISDVIYNQNDSTIFIIYKNMQLSEKL